MNLKLLLAFLTAGTTFASLIPIGAIPSTGNGIGAVNSIVVFQNDGIESGCTGFIGNTTTVGATACNTTVTGSVGGNEQTGSGNNVYTASALGITATGSRTFANLVLIFNGNEPQSAAQSSINLTNLSLNLFANNGTNAVMSFTTSAAQTYTAFPGTGNAGFAFQLDSGQAALANGFLTTNPNLRIGASATATASQGGPEDVFVTTIATVQPGPGGGGGGGFAVPEPASILLLSGGLLALVRLRRFRSC